MEGWRKVVVTDPVPVKLLERVTAPAKPLVAGGLPRLVEDILTLAEPPAVKLTLLELLVRVKPLTLIVMTPEAWAPTLGLVTWFTLNVAEPRFGAVALIDLVIVWPGPRVKREGFTKLLVVIPVVPALPKVSVYEMVPEYPPKLCAVTRKRGAP